MAENAYFNVRIDNNVHHKNDDIWGIMRTYGKRPFWYAVLSPGTNKFELPIS